MKKASRGSIATLLIASGLVALYACTAPAPDERERVGTNAAALAAGTPTIDFDAPGLTSRSIALTFDDGPDDNGTTDQVLDVLKANGVRATFFVNTQNYSDVSSSSAAQRTLRRMIAEGHAVGSHTVHHYDLANSSVDVDAEFAGVDSVLNTYVPAFKQVRLARCPFGSPWFGPQSRLDYVAPIVANYAVHIGWSIDSQDASGCGSSSCVVRNVLNAVDSGSSGVVLMHSVQTTTANGLQQIIDGLRSRGVTFVQVEDMVVAKYGKPSRQLFNCSSSGQCVTGEYCSSATGHCTPNGTTVDSGVADAAASDTGTVDTGAADTGAADTGIPDSGKADSGIADTGIADMGMADSGIADSGPADSGSADSSGDSGLPDSSGAWRAMASSTTRARIEELAVWTSSGMVMWGGQTDDAIGSYLSSGAMYDPRVDAWSTLPTSPLAARTPDVMVTDGTRAYIWGGTNAAFARLRSGGVYDPTSRSWKSLPSAPTTLDCTPQGVWSTTTSELVVFGCRYDSTAGGYAPEGYAYSPARGAWRTLRRPTLDARDRFSAGWAAGRMLVWGGASLLADGSSGATHNDGAAYDPARDQWTSMAAAPIAGRLEAASIAVDATRLALWGGLDAPDGNAFTDGVVVDVAAGTYRAIAANGRDGAMRRYAGTWSNGARLYVWGGRRWDALGAEDRGDGWAYDLASSAWSAMPASPLTAREAPVVVVTGAGAIVWGGVTPDGGFLDGAAL